MTETMFDPSAAAASAPAPTPPQKRALTVLTNSELQSVRDCPQKWDFAYREGLRPKIEARALSFGRTMHEGIRAAVATINPLRAAGLALDTRIELAKVAARDVVTKKHGEWFGKLLRDDLSADELDRLADDAEDTRLTITWMVEHYVDHFRDDWEHLVPIAIERAFRATLVNVRGRETPHLVWTGVWDLVAFDRRIGDVLLIDHKSTSGSIDSIDRRVELDPQMGGYLWALRKTLAKSPESFDLQWLTPAERARLMEHLNALTGRIAYNVLRKKRPRVPEFTQKGFVSVAAIDTLPEFYEAALKEQEAKGVGFERTEKQVEILASLTQRGDNYISRREFNKTDDEIARWRREVFVEASRVREMERDPSTVTRNAGHCTAPWSQPCAYRSICLDDTPELRASFDRVARHVEVEEAEAST